MNSRILIIYEYQILYQILNEVSESLNFKIIQFNKKDLTGAGDLFAAGYLHGVINQLNVKECLIKGTELSSKIIQKICARI